MPARSPTRRTVAMIRPDTRRQYRVKRASVIRKDRFTVGSTRNTASGPATAALGKRRLGADEAPPGKRAAASGASSVASAGDRRPIDSDLPAVDRHDSAGHPPPTSASDHAVSASVGCGGGSACPLVAWPGALGAEWLGASVLWPPPHAPFYTEVDTLGTIGTMAAPKQRWGARPRRSRTRTRAHLKKILGDKAEKRPFFNFHGVTESDESFTRTAVAMEDLTAALLAGLTPVVHNRRLTAALFSLLTTEARCRTS